MAEFYTLHLCGITRELKKVRVAPHLTIASFVMLGDTQLIEKAADALLEKIRGLGQIDMLVCPEAKGIPLTHAIAARMGVDYVVARKSVKAYMEHPIIEETKSITTSEKQIIVIDEMDAAKLDGKRVCVVDDVVFARSGAREDGLHRRQQGRRASRRGRLRRQRFDLSRKAAGLQGLADFPKARRAARRARPFSYRAPFGGELR